MVLISPQVSDFPRKGDLSVQFTVAIGIKRESFFRVQLVDYHRPFVTLCRRFWMQASAIVVNRPGFAGGSNS
jgi:hypothetical protein